AQQKLYWEFEEWITEARRCYGNNRPDFINDKGSLAADIVKVPSTKRRRRVSRSPALSDDWMPMTSSRRSVMTRPRRESVVQQRQDPTHTLESIDVSSNTPSPVPARTPGRTQSNAQSQPVLQIQSSVAPQSVQDRIAELKYHHFLAEPALKDNNMAEKPILSGRGQGTKSTASLPSGLDDQIHAYTQSHGHDEPFAVTEHSFKLIRFYYGNSKPEFTQANGATQNGDQKGVILANSDGHNPRILTDVNHRFLTANTWNDTNMYWTMDIDGRRLIVKHVGSFRLWLGINPGFQKKTIAYPLTQPLQSLSRLSREVSVMTISKVSAHSDSEDMENHAAAAVEKPKPDNHAASDSETNRGLQQILDTDRNYYGNEVPPYVFDNDTDPHPYFAAVLADEHRRRTDHLVTVFGQKWSRDQSFWTVRIEGQDCVVA
ncbi:MAG: hypothetical protein Q9181_008001, partial [Wetmoreana brouardii]